MFRQRLSLEKKGEVRVLSKELTEPTEDQFKAAGGNISIARNLVYPTVNNHLQT